VGPGYQVKFARQIQQEAGILTNAVGMITTGEQAEEILSDGAVASVMIGRAMLGNPRWPIQAAADLGVEIPWPNQYARGFTAR
jgi:2,4-dienoyl-CoA reductase-like NADH-dependent reductase (Old Yellow Enzyme family)